MRFTWDPKKSKELKANKHRKCSFEEAQVIFSHYYVEFQKNDDPDQFLVIGYVGNKLISLVYEPREDDAGEYYHFVTLWRTTPGERKQYEENI